MNDPAKYLGAILAASLGLSASACAQRSVTLVTNAQCRHAIVLEPGASLSEKKAAEELRQYLKACTGVELKVKEGTTDNQEPMIVLGRGPVAQRLGVDPKPEQLGEQGFLLATVPPHVVIAGSRQGGTLYGIHRFLERYLGVRWFAPGVTQTPRVENLEVPSISQLERPAFLWRCTSYAWPGHDADFMARQGYNSGSGKPEDTYGGQYSFDGTCHSYFTYVSPGEFYKTHPEYFSEIGGVRVEVETQLCLSNPDVLEIVTRRMLERMQRAPNVRQHNFSQLDYYNNCECARCREINAKHGTPGGTQFWFLNQLAERTSKVYPNKLVSTLAYMYTEEPPKGLKLHPNVAVWLCHMFPSCDSHSIAACPLNAAYQRRAEAWSKICSHLYAWHYIVDFAHYYNPFPNFRALAADLRFYRDLGVEGIFLQGMGHGGGGGEFSLLRPYYAMKLLWNPDQDANALIRDFLQGYYGPAWKPIGDYLIMLHDQVEQENIHMHLYTNPAQGYLPDPVVRRGLELFDEAEKLAKNDRDLLERVRVARMPLTYARLFPRNGYTIQDGRLTWQGDIGSPSEALGFVEMMKRHGFATVREEDGDPQQMLVLAGLFSTNQVVHTLKNKQLAVDVVPMLAGRVLRIVDTQSRRCVTAHNVTRCLFFPFCGGLEDRVGELFRFHGWIEPAHVVQLNTNSITLRLQTADGFSLQRRLTLDPERPVLRVESKLTNPGDKPKDARLRSHLELDLGELPKTRVHFSNRDGKPIDVDMAKVLAGMREGQHYYSQNAPKGEWTLSGTKGLQLTQRFDTDQIDFTWLYAYPDSLGELEVELWAKRTMLGPGESTTLTQELEVKPR